MRIDINLATTPYENARRFYTRWGIALALMVAATVLLVLGAARAWSANHVLSRNIAEERARLAKLNDEEKADVAILNQPQNRDVRERSAAINSLIVRKSFSWTRIFSDLEKMMPTRLHVVSIAPQLSKENQLQIRMSVAGASREKAIELVQNMEKAADFRNPQIVSEATATKGPGQAQPTDLVTFSIVAQYAPASPLHAPSTVAQASASVKQSVPASTADNVKPPTNAAQRKTEKLRPTPSAPSKGGRP